MSAGPIISLFFDDILTFFPATTLRGVSAEGIRGEMKQ